MERVAHVRINTMLNRLPCLRRFRRETAGNVETVCPVTAGRRDRLLLLALAMLVGAGIAAAVYFHVYAAAPKPPDFALEGLDGKVYTLGELKGKKAVVLNFWASWCPPCQIEAPELVRLYEKYGDKVEIYAIDQLFADDIDNVQEFVEFFGYKFPVLLDKKGTVSRQYGVYGIPTSFFIDESGNLVAKLVGITKPENLEKLFANLAGAGKDS